MIRNYYIELDKFDRWRLEAYLMDHGYKWFDATSLDPYTSGCNPLDSIEEIKKDLEETR